MHRTGWIGTAVLLGALVVHVPKASAQFVVSDPALEGTTVLMQAKQIAQYIAEAQTALQTFALLEIMIREGANLKDHPATDIPGSLQKLQDILTASQGLAGDLATMDQVFRGVYAPYTPSPTVTYADAYNQWAQTTWNTIHSTAQIIGLQDVMMQGDEEVWSEKVNGLNQTDMGQDQLIQLGNAIGTEEVEQLRKLRILMMSDMDSKAAYLAEQTNVQQAQEAAQDQAFTHTQWTGDPKSW